MRPVSASPSAPWRSGINFTTTNAAGTLRSGGYAMWRMLAVLLVGMMVMAGCVDATASAPASGITVPLQRRIYSSSAAERLPVERKTKKNTIDDSNNKRNDNDDNELNPALSQHLRALRFARWKYGRWGNPGPEVDEDATMMREVNNFLKKRAAAADGGESAIAPGGGPKVGKDVLSAVPPKFPKSMGVDQDGNDFAYFAFIEIGSSKTPFKLVLDTGSSNTWIPGSSCTSKACGVMKQLTTKMSSSLKVTSKLFYIQYGTGAVIGSIASDTFRFAGFSVPADFGLVKTVTDDFVDFAIDGVMGLGPAKGEGQAEEKNDMTTIMETLVKQKVIDKKIYGVALGRASDGENNGVINFGALDPAMYQGELEYIDGVRGKGLWELPMVKVKVGEQSLKLEGDVRTAIIDTGTSLFFAPVQDAIRLHSAIPGSHIIGSVFIIPCNTSTPISITFGTNTYNVPPIDFLGPAISPGSEFCISLIGARDFIGTTTWLLGDVFLKNVYSVFDLDEHRIGFAPRKPPQQNKDFKREPWTSLRAELMTPVASLTARPQPTAPTAMVGGKDRGGSGSSADSDNRSNASRLSSRVIPDGWLWLLAGVMGWFLVHR